jgi:esterase/lipase superfamily enzyme
MQREYHKWYSPSLNRDMELLVFGHAGTPVIVFPTSQGRFYQYEDFGMINTLWEKIENGWIQLYCVDSVDEESWYNYGAEPWYRAHRHNQYDNYITNEVLSFIGGRNSNNFLVVTGCSFGAYHSVNYGLRHPDVVKRIVALSGRYSMRGYVAGFFNDDVYYNSPIDFIGGMQEGDFAQKLRQVQTNIVIGEWDVPSCTNETKQLAQLLSEKNISHNLDIWGGADHDWPWWKHQVLKYL